MWGRLAVAPAFREERLVVLIGAHLYDRKTFGDDVGSKRSWQIVDLARPVEPERHALNRVVRLAEDAYPQ